MKPLDNFVERVSVRTGGKFEINTAIAMELGIRREDFPTACTAGVIDGAELSSGAAEVAWPYLGVLNLPYIFGTEEEVIAVQKAIKPITDREFGKNDIMVLFEWKWVGQELFCKEEIPNLMDLHGLKIRGWTENMLEAVKLMGGVPATMPSAEVYAALQRGVVDGGITGSASAIASSWYELAPYAHLFHIMLPINYYGINIKSYEALPDEYKQILLEEAKTCEADYGKAYDDENASAWGTWEDLGGTVIELSEAQLRELKENVGPPLWQKWYDKGGPVEREAYDIVVKALGM